MEEVPLDQELRLYVNWVKKKLRSPDWKESLEEAFEVVSVRRLVLDMLVEEPLPQIEKLQEGGVEEGIAKLIVSNIKPWRKVLRRWREEDLFTLQDIELMLR